MRILIYYFITFFVSQSFAQNCGLSNVTISGEPTAVDTRLVCQGVVMARELVQKHYQIPVDIPLTIEFKNNLYFYWYNENGEIASAHPTYGYFDRNTRIVSMSTFDSDIVQNVERTHFRLQIKKMNIPDSLKQKYIEVLHLSAIIHEIVHALTINSFEYEKPAGGIAEYFSYYIQLEAIRQLQADLFEQIMAQTSGTFTWPEQINMFVHHGDPHAFGTMAYRHFTAMNNSEQQIFVQDCLTGRINPDSIFDSMF